MPLQTSHGTYTSGRKFISILMIPSPEHASHRPPFTLKLNLPFEYPLVLASAVAANKSLIISNTPVYVAGLDLGVLPIGDWSMSITLSSCCVPSIPSHSPGTVLALLSLLARVLYNISLTSELLPEPDTPVTQVITPRGNSTSIFLRLFSLAPNTLIEPVGCLLVSGTSILSLLLRYAPVMDSLTFIMSFAVPSATTCPPCSPAPGPISTIQSAANIVSSSCSTTISVLPRSLSFLSAASSLSLSL